jgi:hypothetical protein
MMNKQQGIRAKLKSRQQGAVAIIVALSLVALIGMLGLVLDLGHLYINKTGLQNAADAAALSGAERLDGTLCRVNSSLSGCNPTQKGAVQYAIETAGRNNYGFNSIPVVINIGDLYLGSCPDRDRPSATVDTDGCTMFPAASIDTAAEATDLTFLQVDTRNRTLNTWFARIWNIFQTTQTYGMAVAGRYVTQISPIAVCAEDPVSEKYVSENGSFPKYLVEFGFRRGVSYELGAINQAKGVPPGISSGDQLYVHPTAKTMSECMGNAPDMVPYLCGGKSTLVGNSGSVVYANTGLQTQKSQDALNTRFGESSAGCVTDADTDLTLFEPSNVTSWMNFTNLDTNPKKDTPNQSVLIDLADRMHRDNPEVNNPESKPLFASIENANEANNGETGGCSGDCRDNYGVLWSNYRTLKKQASITDTPVNAEPSDWPALFRDGPSYVGTTWSAKYNGNGRRVINTLIVNCAAISGNGVCAQIPVVGVGEFFLQTRVDNVAGTNIYAEFGRVIPIPLPSAAQIRLYR